MNRRDIIKAAAILPAAAAVRGATKVNSKAAKKSIKPMRLNAGDKVSVVTPSSGLAAEDFDKAVEHIRSLGFEPKVMPNARKVNGFLAGTDSERLSDLHAAFADKETKGVWCARGGYGATRLLPSIDFSIIKKNPKVFIGYSDITALHVSILRKTGLVTFHGPVGTSRYTDYTKGHCLNAIQTPSAPYKISISEDNAAKESDLFKTRTIRGGKARGKLVGGNLSLLASMAGTEFGLPDLRGKILFIEDVGERPYRVDRMLTQLLQSGNMKSLAGIALGVFEDCDPGENENSPSLFEVVNERLSGLGIPVVYGLSFGHITDQFTLPLGIEAELDADKFEMTFLETGVK
ncbi:MAG: LD-carboxypeptidase [Pyrinomonadaceae bacterium]